MHYNVGDILLVKFPFTNLKKSKKRPILVVKSQNNLGDIVCFQITSNAEQTNLLEIKKENLSHSIFAINSFVKYDKCFTLSSDIIEKKLAKVDSSFLEEVKHLFCSEIF